MAEGAAKSSSDAGVRAIIAPSMLSSDFAKLAEEAERMVSFGADWLHMDVMDGHFVPNLTLGAPIVKALRAHTDADLDCHLMVSDPAAWVGDFAAAGASGFTFHVEAAGDDTATLCQAVRDGGMRVGVAIKPKTPVDEVIPLVERGLVDMVLVMTVEPGFGGQSFMEDMMSKVSTLRERFPTLNIQVDGGLSEATIDKAAAAGANVIVAGTAVFKSPDPAKTIANLRAAIDERKE